LNVLPDAVVPPQFCETVIKMLAKRYSARLNHLNVSEVEFKINAKHSAESHKIPLRIVSSNPTGYVLSINSYVESREVDSGRIIFSSIADSSKSVLDASGLSELSLDGCDNTTPYPVQRSPFDMKRQQAAATTDTVYCYDFIPLFDRALEILWHKAAAQGSSQGNSASVNIPSQFITEATELVLRSSLQASKFDTNNAKAVLRVNGAEGVDHPEDLFEVNRLAGRNDIGMVAWRIHVNTPECPEANNGRDIVLISNDITHKVGSFGTREDALFNRASIFARVRGLPRLYAAANSGARIGMAEEVKSCFKICWKDASNPQKGYHFLYLSAEDAQNLKKSVRTKIVQDPLGSGEDLHMITDIIGLAPDLGVENLRGSGTIAGETSRSYNENFTLTYVTGRCVGIGAYLVRLGQRTIQKAAKAPILLTGYQALNKLMGKPVYTSNQQLGGPNIMYTNGVSHEIVQNDLEGVVAMLRWLSYVPSQRGGPLPFNPRMLSCDASNVNRPVQVRQNPNEDILDPRLFLTGFEDAGSWVGGFFDRGSWTESLQEWAQTVVVGRARLGGYPMGVIITETRSRTVVIPADPASPESGETVVQQAGQVWFPDSAYKTAQAIRDFSSEELPLMIFANWRGFSGGQRDMFDEVLKFGSQIVDALVGYKQPVFVYLPPNATLRGGAWVVVDSTINKAVMEMYADPTARAGVLETAGLVEIKYRRPQLVATAHRLDATLIQFDAEKSGLEKQLEKLTVNPEAKAFSTGNSESESQYEGLTNKLAKVNKAIKEREVALLSTYTQIANQLVDLQDTPGRMMAVGAIHGIIDWSQSRSYFYWRLRRKLAEFALRKQVVEIVGKTSEIFSPSEANGIVDGNGDKDSASLLKAASYIRQWYIEDESKNKSGFNQSGMSWSAYASGGGLGDLSFKGEDAEQTWNDDKRVLSWMRDERQSIERKIYKLRRKAIASRVCELGEQDADAVVQGVLEMIDALKPSAREKAVGLLRRGVIFVNPTAEKSNKNYRFDDE
jgi:acetyl-CoA carboxylase carboxyltransferase component